MFVCVCLCVTDRVSLPRNMIENSMFEEEPDIVDLAKDSSVFPIYLSSPIPTYTTYYYIRPLFYFKIFVICDKIFIIESVNVTKSEQTNCIFAGILIKC